MTIPFDAQIGACVYKKPNIAGDPLILLEN